MNIEKVKELIKSVLSYISDEIAKSELQQALAAMDEKPTEQSDYIKQLKETIYEQGALGQTLAFELCNEYEKLEKLIKELKEYKLIYEDLCK